MPRHEHEPVQFGALAVLYSLDTFVRRCAQLLQQPLPMLEDRHAYELRPLARIHTLLPLRCKTIQVLGSVGAQVTVQIALQVHGADMDQQIHPLDASKPFDYREWKV